MNGSGKHNNWSIATDDGTNILNVGQLEKASGSGDIFPILMSALVKAIDENGESVDHKPWKIAALNRKYPGDLMRMAIACPGNDFRLGACEAPPAIVSTYLGDDMTTFLESFKSE